MNGFSGSDPKIARLYDALIEEEDARLCDDLPSSACREVPGNFFRILASTSLTGIGDMLASPKIVLTWLLGSVGAPGAVIAWLVPLRESGALIPQMLLGAWVRRRARRAGCWVLGSALQGLCVTAMAAAVWSLEGAAAGWAVLGLLAVFSLARGLCSIAMKDVQGKTIPKARRGRLGGLAGTVSGVAVVGLGVFLFGQAGEPERTVYLYLLLAAAMLWFVAAVLFAGVVEADGETGGGRDVISELRRSAGLIGRDERFRRFVVTRALLMCSALSAPFLVLLVQRGGTGLELLGAFLLAGSLASSVSASFWGWAADRSSRRVMIQAGTVAAGTCLFAAIVGWLAPSSAWLAWLLVPAYFVLSIAHAGVRLGRKTYLLDMAGGNKRTEYVAVGNTIIGFALLGVGALSGLASVLSLEAALTALGVMGTLGVASARGLPEL